MSEYVGFSSFLDCFMNSFLYASKHKIKRLVDSIHFELTNAVSDELYLIVKSFMQIEIENDITFFLK